MDQDAADDEVALHQPNDGQLAGVAMTQEFFDNISSRIADATGDIHQARQITKEGFIECLLRKAGIEQVYDIMEKLGHVTGMEIKALRRDNQCLQEDIEIFLGEKKVLQAETKYLQDLTANLISDNENLQGQKKKFEDANAELLADMWMIQAESDKFKDERQKLQAGMMELQDKYQAERQTHETEQQNERERALTELTTLQTQTSSQIEALQEDNERLQKLVLEIKADRIDLGELYSTLEVKNQVLENKNKDLVKRNADKETQTKLLTMRLPASLTAPKKGRPGTES